MPRRGGERDGTASILQKHNTQAESCALHVAAWRGLGLPKASLGSQLCNRCESMSVEEKRRLLEVYNALAHLEMYGDDSGLKYLEGKYSHGKPPFKAVSESKTKKWEIVATSIFAAFVIVVAVSVLAMIAGFAAWVLRWGFGV